MKSIKILFIFLFLFSLTFISAQPPFDSGTFEYGLKIERPEINTLKLNTDFQFNFHVFNSTDGRLKTNETTTCAFHLYNSTGNEILQNHYLPYKSTDFYQDVLGGNFSSVGYYYYNIQCNDSSAGGYNSVGLEVTPNGFNGTLGFYILILILSLGVILFGYYAQDTVIVLLGSFGLAFIGLYLLFYGIVGIKDSIYTEGLAIIIMGLSAYLMFRSSSEFLN